MLPTDKQARKERPIARGVLSYFPDAIAEVANVSYVGNKQHNGDAPMHWARGKSDDHADCIARHLIERGTIDNDGLRHSAKLAWRALANLQIEIEGDRAQVQPGDHDYHLPAPKPEAAAQKFFDRPERERDFKELIRLGCPDQVARLIVMGTTYADRPANESVPYAYVAGPMRGIPKFNFPAFDEARDLLVSQGYNVISPADIDRHDDVTDETTLKESDQRDYAFRDFWALYFLSRINQGNNAIVMLRNYERSTGATAEYGVAKWLGLKLREIGEFARPDVELFIRRPNGVQYRVVGGRPQYLADDGSWNNSTEFYTTEAFNNAIKKGELIPCDHSSLETCMSLSATPDTCASAMTCATSSSATR